MSKINSLNITSLNFSTLDNKPFVIAGPCSAETPEQVMQTAIQLKQQGFNIFRAGVWKPRTKPGTFEGQGKKALPWLLDVKKQTNMLIATEVATAKHVEQALKYDVDILWIGARTTANPFAVQDIANALKGVNNVRVLIKNPINPDIELWIGALERLNIAGITKLAAIHRGFSNYNNGIYRNTPMWQIAIELRRRFSQLPIICDPSHIGGKRTLIKDISQQAINLGYDGLIVESHCNPNKAWSDASQQITPQELNDIMSSLIVKNKTSDIEDINIMRTKIDEIDYQLINLLSERMNISREIGKYKKEKNLTILQSMRYKNMIENRCKQAIKLNVSEHFIRKLFEFIHQESIEQQM